jgi:hypothetical protein
MSYIGLNPTQQLTTPAVDYFNGNGVTTTFQLTRAVTSVNAIQVVVNNVPQNAREAYGITAGNQIVFTSAPSAGTNNIYVIYDSQVGQFVTPSPGTVTASALAPNSVTTNAIAPGAVVAADLDVTNLNGTGAMILPLGTTAQRPAIPAIGQLRYNSTIGLMEYYDGSIWQTVGFKPISATGGTVSTLTVNGVLHNVHTFSYTGADQTFSVSNFGSAGTVTVYMWAGAGGGANGEGFTDPGGAGGYAEGRINLLTNNFSSLIVQVGQGGSIGRGARPYPAGGLPSVRSGYTSGAGGGRSAIFNSSVSVGTALVIAGGGGGGAGHGGGGTGRGSQGGAGGGTTGESGYSSYLTPTPNGATQTAAGAWTSRSFGGVAPAQLQGGDAGDGTAWSTGWNQAGGGGDGWWGGGAIDGQHIGGGGGSGYVHPTFVTSGVLTANFANSNAAFLGPLNPPQTGNTFYAAGVGVANNNANGGNGRVVIIYPLSQTF